MKFLAGFYVKSIHPIISTKHHWLNRPFIAQFKLTAYEKRSSQNSNQIPDLNISFYHPRSFTTFFGQRQYY